MGGEVTPVSAHGPVCECCEKRTLEPVYHSETGDAFCGACAVELLGGEVKLLREALDRLCDTIGDVRVSGLAARTAALHEAWKGAREALALREDTPENGSYGNQQTEGEN